MRGIVLFRLAVGYRHRHSRLRGNPVDLSALKRKPGVL